jgi:hypothetical protein
MIERTQEGLQERSPPPLSLSLSLSLSFPLSQGVFSMHRQEMHPLLSSLTNCLSRSIRRGATQLVRNRKASLRRAEASAIPFPRSLHRACA